MHLYLGECRARSASRCVQFDLALRSSMSYQYFLTTEPHPRLFHSLPKDKILDLTKLEALNFADDEIDFAEIMI